MAVRSTSSFTSSNHCFTLLRSTTRPPRLSGNGAPMVQISCSQSSAFGYARMTSRYLRFNSCHVAPAGGSRNRIMCVVLFWFSPRSSAPKRKKSAGTGYVNQRSLASFGSGSWAQCARPQRLFDYIKSIADAAHYVKCPMSQSISMSSHLKLKNEIRLYFWNIINTTNKLNSIVTHPSKSHRSQYNPFC